MYGDGRAWAHDSIGATAPAQQWYLAEGCTDGGFETFVLVQNPGDAEVRVDLALQTDTGEVRPNQLRGVAVPPGARRTFKLNDYVTCYDVSTLVTSEGGGVVCERAMYGDGRAWAHDSIGATAPARQWYLAEGCTDGGFETWVLVQNPGSQTTGVRLTYMTDAGIAPGPTFDLPPGCRRSVNVQDRMTAYAISTRVESDYPVVVERATYYRAGEE
jgi:hypothetical protein